MTPALPVLTTFLISPEITLPLLSPEDFSYRPALVTWTLHGVTTAGRQPGMCPLHVWTHPGLAWPGLH